MARAVYLDFAYRKKRKKRGQSSARSAKKITGDKSPKKGTGAKSGKKGGATGQGKDKDSAPEREDSVSV